LHIKKDTSVPNRGVKCLDSWVQRIMLLLNLIGVQTEKASENKKDRCSLAAKSVSKGLESIFPELSKVKLFHPGNAIIIHT